MSATLSLEAQHRLERYLQEVRLLLRGATGVDAGEVERDIRDHIETELGGRTSPVSREELENVLRRLGSPGGWVDESEVPPWRRALARLYLGEDWRLAYLCLGTTVVGALFLLAGSALALVLFGAGFLLARAAVSLAEERGEKLGARRLLVLAPIAVVVVPALIGFLAGPLLPLGQAGYDEGWFASLGIGPPEVDAAGREAAVRAALIAAALGAWWLVLSALRGVLQRPLVTFLRPLFGPQTRHWRWLLVAGAVLTVAGVAVLTWLAEGRVAL